MLANSLQFIKVFLRKIQQDEVADVAALLAYYFFLSLFPLLFFVLSLLPYFDLEKEVVIQFITDYAPGETAGLIIDNINAVLEQPQGGLVSLSLLATLWAASNGTSALIRSINRAYNETENRSFVKTKLLGIFLTVALVVVIVITLLLPVFGQLILNGIEFFVEIPEPFVTLFNVSRYGIGFGIMVFVLMILYYIAPCKKIRLREGVWGALFATFGWQLISYGFSYYVNNFGNYTATYGALGGVIVLLLWFFLTGFIIMVGGEINATIHQLYSDQKGSSQEEAAC